MRAAQPTRTAGKAAAPRRRTERAATPALTPTALAEAETRARAAEAELQKALELKPDYGIAHFNLALMMLEQRPPSIELAKRHYEKALSLGVAKDEVVEQRLKE
jgi:Tfp pilus assembly protein PilF